MFSPANIETAPLEEILSRLASGQTPLGVGNFVMHGHVDRLIKILCRDMPEERKRVAVKIEIEMFRLQMALAVLLDESLWE